MLFRSVNGKQLVNGNVLGTYLRAVSALGTGDLIVLTDDLTRLVSEPKDLFFAKYRTY